MEDRIILKAEIGGVRYQQFYELKDETSKLFVTGLSEAIRRFEQYIKEMQEWGDE